MDFDVENYLHSKFSTVRRDGREAHVHCPFHDEDPSKRGRLYINVDPSSESYGLWDCKVCGESGNFNQLRRFFGDEPIYAKSGSDLEPEDTSAEINDVAAHLYHRKLLENKDVLGWLNARGIEMETVERFKLGFADGSLQAHLHARGYSMHEAIQSGLITERGVDFHDGCLTIPYYRANKCIQIRGRYFSGPAKYKTPAGSGAFLFNSDTAYSAETLLVCEGEFDAMRAEQEGFNAVGIPGVTSWKSKMKGDWDAYFNMARKVVVVFDGDNAGRKAADELTAAIGPKATSVDLGDDVDLSDWFLIESNDAEVFSQMIRKTSSGFLLSVDDAFDMWEEDQADLKDAIPFGFPGIDEALQKGMLPGQVAVVLAKTGAGKTAYILSAFERIAKVKPDSKFMFFSLEQTAGEWADRAWKVHRFYKRIPDADEARDRTREFWRPRLRIVEKNRVTEEEFRQALDMYGDEMGALPDIVAVDYLGYFSRSFRGDAYERTTAAIMKIKEIAKEYRIRIVTPHQVSRGAKAGQRFTMDDARDSGAVEETADFLITYWRTDMQTDVGLQSYTGEIKMHIEKSRHGGAGKESTCVWAPMSTAVVPVVDPLRKYAEEEVKHDVQGVLYEDSFQKQMTADRYSPVARRSPKLPSTRGFDL